MPMIVSARPARPADIPTTLVRKTALPVMNALAEGEEHPLGGQPPRQTDRRHEAGEEAPLVREGVLIAAHPSAGASVCQVDFLSPAGPLEDVVAQVGAWLTDPDDRALVIATRSTGEPKRVVLPRRHLASVAASAARLGASGRWVLALPRRTSPACGRAPLPRRGTSAGAAGARRLAVG